MQSDQSGQTRGCAIGSLNCGLVGYWTFNNQDMNWKTGTVNDVSGNANNGQLLGKFSTTTSPVPGKMGQGLRFDGVGNYVNLGTSATLIGAGTKTIAMWVNLVSTGAGEYLYTQYDGSGTNSWGKSILVNSNGTIQAAWTSAGFSTPYYLSTNAILFNKWSHVAFIFSGSTGTLYINGVSQGSQSIGTEDTNVDQLRLCGRWGATANTGNAVMCKGSLDDVRIYNRALSASEVKQLYLAGQVTMQSDQSGATRGCAIGSLNCGLVGYWTINNQDMNWKTGAVTDSSGNGNTGQLIGMSTTTSPVPGKMGQALEVQWDEPVCAMTTTRFNTQLELSPRPPRFRLWFKFSKDATTDS